MAFAGSISSPAFISQRRNKPWNEKEVTIELDRELYFDKDAVTGDLVFKTTSEHIYENASVFLLCIFRPRAMKAGIDNSFVAFSSRWSAGTTDSGILVVPGGIEMRKPFRFTVPEHSPPSFACREGEVLWLVRFNTTTEAGTDVVAYKRVRKACMYHALPGFTPQASAERIWRTPAMRVLALRAWIAKDVYESGEGIDITLVAECSNADTMPIKKITTKVIQTVYVTNVSDTTTYFSGIVKSQQELLARDYVLDRSVFDKLDRSVVVNGSDHSVRLEKVFAVLPRVDDKAECAHQLADDPTAPPLLAPSTALQKEVQVETAPDRLDVYDQVIEVKYEVVVKVRVAKVRDTVLLSLPFNITSAAREAWQSGLTQDEIEALTMFPVTFDQDLPEYDDVDRMSVPTFSDVESLASVASFTDVPVSMTRSSLSARDLVQLAHDVEAMTVAAGVSFMRTNSTGSTGPAPAPRAEVGVRRARQRQTSVSERRLSVGHIAMDVPAGPGGDPAQTQTQTQTHPDSKLAAEQRAVADTLARNN